MPRANCLWHGTCPLRQDRSASFSQHICGSRQPPRRGSTPFSQSTHFMSALTQGQLTENTKPVASAGTPRNNGDNDQETGQRGNPGLPTTVLNPTAAPFVPPGGSAVGDASFPSPSLTSPTSQGRQQHGPLDRGPDTSSDVRRTPRGHKRLSNVTRPTDWSGVQGRGGRGTALSKGGPAAAAGAAAAAPSSGLTRQLSRTSLNEGTPVAARTSAAIAVPNSAPERNEARGSGSAVLGRSPSTGSKGVIIPTELLSFRYQAPGAGPGHATQQGPRGGADRGRYRKRGGNHSRPAPYNKNKFLQANFRFIVSDAIDMKKYSTDADLMLKWDDVVQVEMLTSSPIQCPISLESPPHCPQITPCGHVFAFHAVMQHLLHHGGPQLQRAAPCPLCFALIAARELRLVHIKEVVPVEVGQECLLQLLRRPKGSILAEAVHPHGQPVPATHPNTRVANGHKHSSSASCKAATASGDPLPARGPWGGTGRVRNSCDDEGEVGLPLLSAYTKFAVVTDPAKLWREAAKQLADLAIEITLEAGREAAQEADAVYRSLDALERRARTWAERRQESLLQAADPIAASKLPTVQEAGAAAALVVKQVSAADVVSEAKQRAEQQKASQAAQQQRVEEFPALAPPAVSSTAAAAAADSCATAAVSGQADAHQDDEEQAVLGSSDEDGVHPASSPVGLAAQNRTPAIGSTGSSVPSGSLHSLTGTSPPGAQALEPENSSHVYFYQSADGQWAFLHPLNMRMLLHAVGGSVAALPSTISALVLEKESLVQTEQTRRKLRVLQHIPMAGTFDVCELNMSTLTSADTAAVFEEEVTSRKMRREARAQAQRRKAQREEEQRKREEAARLGPSAEELRAMPALPGAPEDVPQQGAELDEDIALSLALMEGGSPPPNAPVSYSRITKMGFAATGPPLAAAPATGTSPPVATGPKPWATALGPTGAWAQRKEGAAPGSYGTPATPPSISTPAAASGAWGRASSVQSAATAAAALDGSASSSTPSPSVSIPAATGKGKGRNKGIVLISSNSHHHHL